MAIRPNISGGFIGRPNELDAIGAFGGGSGAFNTVKKGGKNNAQVLLVGETLAFEDSLTFQSSRSSSLYKNAILQPKALVTLPCIRI